MDMKHDMKRARKLRRDAIRQAKRDLRAAEDALDKNDRRERKQGIDYETSTYLDLNRAVHAAHRQLKTARRRKAADYLRDVRA